MQNTRLFLVVAVVSGFSSVVFAQSVGKPLTLPTLYDEHRFLVEPVTINGAKLIFFTDTGGGNALQYFRVTVDYPNAVAYFEK